MNRYNVKVNDQIYQVEVADVEANTTNNEESSASICFEAIKAEYDYCVTRAEKLENKVYILLAACAFIFPVDNTNRKSWKCEFASNETRIIWDNNLCPLTCYSYCK